jgi:hypothetical protein
MKLYMFRTNPLSIIRSFSLYTRQWYMSFWNFNKWVFCNETLHVSDNSFAHHQEFSLYTRQCYMSFWNFHKWVFCNGTLHVSDNSFVHHQEFFTVHSAMVYVILKFSQMGILQWNSTCFGQFLCPSSGVFHYTHSNGICHSEIFTNW